MCCRASAFPDHEAEFVNCRCFMLRFQVWLAASRLRFLLLCIALKIILPLGISFYTFQTISYTVDVYRRKISPEKDFILYASYVTFFPQLVAGPILRAGEVVVKNDNNEQVFAVKGGTVEVLNNHVTVLAQ